MGYQNVGVTSPFAAAFSVPLTSSDALSDNDPWMNDYFPPSWALVGGYFAFSFLLISILSLLMIWLFNTRWRVSQ